MTDTLRAVLQTFPGLEYTLRTEDTSRIERYGIGRETEMNRRVDIRRLNLTLYKVFEADGKRYRGSYATEIHPTATEADMRDIITQGLFAAGFVKNEYYPLPEPEADAPDPEAETSDKPEAEISDPGAVLQAYLTALHTHDHHEKGRLCYNEIYLTHTRTRILNSNGIDAAYATDTVYVETAVHWQGDDGRETEITERIDFSHTDTEAGAALLADKIRHLFTVAAQKSKAKPLPPLTDIPVLLTGDCLPQLFSYYYHQANAAYAYRRLSQYEAGQAVQGEGEGDRLTLTLDPFLPGSTYGAPYDSDGKKLARHTVIDRGVLTQFWGSVRFAHYLAIPPTGSIGNMLITGGTATDEALRAEPYLELVSFSAFQMNAVTGDFGSEIRLGYYFNGSETIPVTGGSISGNIKNVQAGMRMSVAESQYNHYRGPATVLIRGASIAGVETA